MSDVEIRGLVEAGLTQREVAERLGVGQASVSRALAASRPASNRKGPALKAVDKVARSLGDPSPYVRARIEAARVLASKLDWSTSANTGSAALAAASLVKELRSILDELQQSASMEDLREALLAGDDD